MKERRSVQRIRFAEPLEGKIRARRISILDLSTQGACIQHASPLKCQEEVELELPWKEHTVRITAVVTRCTLSHVTSGSKGQSVHVSGLSFREMDESIRGILQNLLDEFVQRSITEGRNLGGGSLPSKVGGIPLEIWLRNKLK